MNDKLIEQLTANDKAAFNKLNRKVKAGILNYDFNSIDELRNCINKGFYPNKMATFVYKQYQYNIINCKCVNDIKSDIDKAMNEMKLMAKNKVELNYLRKNEYGPNALKNCVCKNRHLNNDEKANLYQYIDCASL